MKIHNALHQENCLLLASSSKYRAQLLTKLHIPFQQQSPNIQETPAPKEDPKALALRLSQSKAEALCALHNDKIIIGSDQVVWDSVHILGKPGSIENAFAQLKSMQGKTISVYTGLALLAPAKKFTGQSTTPCTKQNEITPKLINGAEWLIQRHVDHTRVKFRTLSDTQIKQYIDKDMPIDCAGSFKAESLGITLFEALESSDPNALIGLPLIKLYSFLLNLSQ